jgi:hypothetical protein
MQGAIAEGEGESDFTGVARVERLVWAMPGVMSGRDGHSRTSCASWHSYVPVHRRYGRSRAVAIGFQTPATLEHPVQRRRVVCRLVRVRAGVRGA